MNKQMEYNIENAKLWSEWKDAPLHQGQHMITDGIVDPQTWFSGKRFPKVLIVLKEAYGEIDSLCDLLCEDNTNNIIWKRTAEWINGILNTTSKCICPYRSLDNDEANRTLRQVAIMNIKKSAGMPSSSNDNLQIYVKDAIDSALLRRQFELIDPDVVICGNTFGLLNEALDYSFNPRQGSNVNRFYRDGKRRLYLDYYHPSAFKIPTILKYCGLACCYQQALLAAFDEVRSEGL